MSAGLPAHTAADEGVVPVKLASPALALSLARGQKAHSWREAELPLLAGLPAQWEVDGSHQVSGENAAAGVVEDIGTAAGLVLVGERVATATAHVPTLQRTAQAELPLLLVQKLPLQRAAVALPEVAGLHAAARDRGIKRVVSVAVKA